MVELIIVITILGILATIAFISFQGYSKNARDGNRITTLKNIGKSLEVYKIQTGNYPQPDDSINIEASGTLIGYQGNIGYSISRLINMNTTPTDPSDKEKYLYSISGDKKKYQVLGYLETTEYLSLLPKSYAVDYSNRYIKTEGDKVGVILDTNKNPLSGVTKVDVATGSTVYNVYFGDKDVVNGSGNLLFSNIYNRRSDLIKNKTFANLDKSLVLYLDMETMTGGKVKDLSSYGNNGTLSGGVTLSNGTAYISGTGAGVYIDDNDTAFNFYQTNKITVTILVKTKQLPIQTTWYSLVSQHLFGNGGNGSSFNLAVGCPSNNGYFHFSTGTFVPSTCTLDNVNDGNRHLLVGSYDGSNLNIYKDGALSTTKTSNGNISNSNYKISIGNESSGYFNSALEIGEVRFYNRALSDSEVQELYNSTK